MHTIGGRVKKAVWCRRTYSVHRTRECGNWRHVTGKRGSQPVTDKIHNVVAWQRGGEGNKKVREHHQSFTLFTQSMRRQHAFRQIFAGKGADAFHQSFVFCRCDGGFVFFFSLHPSGRSRCGVPTTLGPPNAGPSVEPSGRGRFPTSRSNGAETSRATTRHSTSQEKKTSLHKKRTDKERQVTCFLQDLSPDELRMLEEVSQPAGTEDDSTETAASDKERDEEEQTELTALREQSVQTNELLNLYMSFIMGEMKKMEDAYYQLGAAIAFKTEKTKFPYVSKEFNVRTTGDGIQVQCMVDLENAFPEQVFIRFTMQTQFSDQIPESSLGKPDAGKTMLGME